MDTYEGRSRCPDNFTSRPRAKVKAYNGGSEDTKQTLSITYLEAGGLVPFSILPSNGLGEHFSLCVEDIPTMPVIHYVVSLC